ncbi:hypothetical protein SAMN04488134_103302 [Amphibacillus marinus]|uniref:Uncharacterized protein n=1 Tax=Amphibacillus marinus TaxID=872970 RepID=A0A1H8LRW8_9BACI|nr:DUF5692 family protein [Amphibacillus marinus]SEO07841.1 hypothetical protein SAMN04488134_103302 [Amphibacillus marinus]
MFFFEQFPWYNMLVWLVVLAILIVLNELVRRSKRASVLLFICLPMVLTVFWYLNRDNEITSWFTWIKVYSALLGSLIFMGVRFSHLHNKYRWYKGFVAAILAVNILEAVVREFQVGLVGFEGMVDGMYYISGGWNYLNAVAGLLNLLLICGWVGIKASDSQCKDMVWHDQSTLYIIAYGIWNIAYVYACAPGNAFYSGFGLNIAATIPALLWAKGTWMQTRAHTLSFWMIWVMTFPYFFAEGSVFNVTVSYNPIANWSLSIISLVLNMVLACWQVYRIIKYRLHPFKNEIWSEFSSSLIHKQVG